MFWWLKNESKAAEKLGPHRFRQQLTKGNGASSSNSISHSAATISNHNECKMASFEMIRSYSLCLQQTFHGILLSKHLTAWWILITLCFSYIQSIRRRNRIFLCRTTGQFETRPASHANQQSRATTNNDELLYQFFPRFYWTKENSSLSLFFYSQAVFAWLVSSQFIAKHFLQANLYRSCCFLFTSMCAD